MFCVKPLLGCDFSRALISPGNILIRSVNDPDFFPGADEHLVIDAMTGPDYVELKFAKAIIELKLLSPAGVRFVAPNINHPPRPFAFASYEMIVTPGTPPIWVPHTGDSLCVRYTRWENPLGVETVLNQNNSSSFYFGLKGRGNAAINLQAAVFATGNVLPTVGSCNWEIRELNFGESIAQLHHQTFCS